MSCQMVVWTFGQTSYEYFTYSYNGSKNLLAQKSTLTEANNSLKMQWI